MSRNDNRRPSQSDHDLLIELNTRFSQFMNEGWMTLNGKVDSFLEIIQAKADKDDVRELRTEVSELLNRVGKLENTHENEGIRKQSFISIGKMGLSGWHIVTGGIITILTLLQMVQAAAG